MGWFSRQQRTPGRLAVFAEQAGHPRECGAYQWSPELTLPRIGYFIDWLDSRPEAQVSDQTAIEWSRGNAVVQIAALLASRTPATKVADEFKLVIIPGVEWEHASEYGPEYHAEIVGCLQEDELAAAWETYGKLRSVHTRCVSALVNLAELERRAGNTPDAERLLREALLLTSSDGVRHRIADGRWRIHVRSALARLGRVDPNPDAAAVVATLRGGELEGGAAMLRELRRGYYRDTPGEQGRQRAEDLAVAMHAAFGQSDGDMRISIHAAMWWAETRPQPPPSWYPNRETFSKIREIASSLRR